MSTDVDASGIAHRRRSLCPAGRGRHLDESRDADILQAALELLAELGYDRLTIEAVAARAKAGKATLYRRWQGKAELIVDAVACFDEDLARLTVDTGSLRGDLRRAFIGALDDVDEFQIGLMTGLMTALRRHPDLAKVFEERFIGKKMVLLKKIFERARERGEVSPGHDIELLASVGPGILFHRLLLTGKPLTRHYVARVIDEVILPLAGASVNRKAQS